jgi:Domain of unknown function (DUF4136)
MLIRLKKIFVPLVIVVAGLSSCYPVDDLQVEDLDVAATLYDKNYYDPATGVNKFQDFQTFNVVDTIIHIIDDADDDPISRKFDDFILEQVRLNMLQLGYIEETDPETNAPDVTLTVSAMSSEHEVYTWYPYWGWYWGYGGYYPYSAKAVKDTPSALYYYYPWYPYGTYYTYQSGSILMEMVEVARIDPEVEAIPVVWAAIVNGVLEESQSGAQARLSKGIDQCFDQSPYLLKSIE